MLRDHAAAALTMHRETELAAAGAGAEEPAAEVARAERKLDTDLRFQRGAALAARHGNTGATADDFAPVEQLEPGASSPGGASGATWSSLSADDWQAANAAIELLAASPWRMLNTNDETPVVTLQSALSEVAAARLEPQLWRLQVIMYDHLQNALCTPA